MKISLGNEDHMSIESLSDLVKLIPETLEGEALNYGQGEGQLRVGKSVWGFYSDDSSRYYFILEEGELELHEATNIALGILSQIQAHWGHQITGKLTGCHHLDPEMRLI